MKINKRVLLLAFLFLVSSFVVMGQQDRLSDLVAPVASLDIANVYQNYSLVVDTIIYFIVFISIAKLTLGKQFEGRGGKGLVVGLGIALSFAMTFWAMRSGFRIGRLGPLAAIMFAIFIALMLFRMLAGGEEGKGPMFWFSVMVIYISLYMFFPELIEILQENTWGRLVLGIFTIIFVIAIPMWIAGLFKGGEEGAAAKPFSLFGGKPAKEKAASKAASDLEEEDIAEEKESEAEKRTIKELENVTKADIWDTKKIIKNLESILGVAKKWDIKKEDVRAAVQEKLEGIRNEEEEIKEAFSLLNKNKRALGKYLTGKFELSPSEEKELRELAALRANENLLNSDDDNKLHEDAKKAIKGQLYEYKENVEKAYNKAYEKESEYLKLFDKLIASMKLKRRTITNTSIRTKIKKLIKIKKDQEKYFKALLKSEEIMEYWDNREIIDGLREIQADDNVRKAIRKRS